MSTQPTLDENLDFPEQFDELWHQIEEIATRAIDEHHDCGGFEDAHIIANEVRKLLADYIQRLVGEIEKAYGGCRICYGKGYATERAGLRSWRTRNRPNMYVDTRMKFCTCERGKQLESLLSTIKVPPEVGEASPHTRRKEKT